MNKTILIMIDGISADQFSKKRRHLPHLDRLAQQGTQLESLTPEFAGTSCPGRSSIINGGHPCEHGVYANKIYDAAQDIFRWANPYDILTPTIATYATQQGKSVANLGYGMVKPEDCSLYIGPWWADEMLIRGRDQEPTPSDKDWIKASGIHDPDNILSQLPTPFNQFKLTDPANDPENLIALGSYADQTLLELAGHLTALEKSPDLILTEIAITDYYLHKYGTDHPMTDYGLRQADAKIGQLLEIMRQHGTLDHYNFVILSDHGHAAMPKALYIDKLFHDDPELNWSSEGGVLLVKHRDEKHAKFITNRLKEHHIEPWNDHHLPNDLKEKILTFVVPENLDISFETSKTNSSELYGPSKYKSNHGMRPGRREDFRFCIFSGPRIKEQTLPHSMTNQIAPSIASIIDVKTVWDENALEIIK